MRSLGTQKEVVEKVKAEEAAGAVALPAATR